jgi:hypothetical protein
MIVVPTTEQSRIRMFGKLEGGEAETRLLRCPASIYYKWWVLASVLYRKYVEPGTTSKSPHPQNFNLPPVTLFPAQPSSNHSTSCVICSIYSSPPLNAATPKCCNLDLRVSHFGNRSHAA